jgi:hypothetical protein
MAPKVAMPGAAGISLCRASAGRDRSSALSGGFHDTDGSITSSISGTQRGKACGCPNAAPHPSATLFRTAPPSSRQSDATIDRGHRGRNEKLLCSWPQQSQDGAYPRSTGPSVNRDSRLCDRLTYKAGIISADARRSVVTRPLERWARMGTTFQSQCVGLEKPRDSDVLQ